MTNKFEAFLLPVDFTILFLRNKFPHLIKTGAAKALFKPEDESAAGSQQSGKNNRNYEDNAFY